MTVMMTMTMIVQVIILFDSDIWLFA